MNAATEFDIGPLTWVKGEIDLALDRALQALAPLAETPDPTQLRFCQTHLHQVHGALEMVGLDGAARVCDALEQVIRRLGLELPELPELPATAAPPYRETIALAQNAIGELRHYLDDLISGLPDQPLRLLPLYRQLQAARGLTQVAPSDLFFPDLSIRPPRRETARPGTAPPKNLPHLLRQQRAHFQKGLLAWLQAPQAATGKAGIARMRDALGQIEAMQESAASRSFWWITRGFLATLEAGAQPPAAEIKQLCARIDLQIRRLMEGSRHMAERLMRDALYYVGTSEPAADTTPGLAEEIRGLQQAFALPALLPAKQSSASSQEEELRRRLREGIANVEESWNKFCAGSSQALTTFRDQTQMLHETTGKLTHTDLRRLSQSLAACSNWVAEQPARHSELLAMETATAILLYQHAIDHFGHIGRDFAHQVDVMVARLHGCIAGQAPARGAEVPALDAMSRQAQERLLVGQVAREIQSNLAHIEQVLDGFFRNVDRRGELNNLQNPLTQIRGALAMLQQEAAAATLANCEAQIHQFAQPGYQPLASDFETVAEQLSLLGFFVGSLRHGDEDYQRFVQSLDQTHTSNPSSSPSADEMGTDTDADTDTDPAGTAAATATSIAAAADATGDPAEESGADVSLESQIAAQRKATRALLDACRAAPEDAGLAQQLRQHLEALQRDADLIADQELAQLAEAALAALDGGHDATRVDQAVAGLSPEPRNAPPPSAATMQLAQASSEDFDAEMLEIFIEEAKEVLATIGSHLRGLQSHPHGHDELATVRRGYHTLKGSGRMVGLKDLGEVAWHIEQVINLWLRQERPISDELFRLIAEGHGLFGLWVRHLESGKSTAPDASSVVALAQRLLSQGEDKLAAVMPAHAPLQATPPPPEPQAAASTLLAEPEPAADSSSLPGLEEAIDLLGPALPMHEATELSEPTEPAAAMAATADATDAESAAEDSEPDGAAGSSASTGPAAEAMLLPEPLLQIFLEEARGHLAQLQTDLSTLVQAPNQPTPETMTRAAHTLAGISGTLGLPALNSLGHAAEMALLRRDVSELAASSESLEILRQTVTCLDEMISAVAAHQQPRAEAALTSTLDSLYPPPGATETTLAAAPQPPAAVEPANSAAAAASVAAAAAAAAPPPQVFQDELDEQLLPIFLEEATVLCEAISTSLRQWRDQANHDAPGSELARQLHTLKGSARMAGAMNLGELVHRIEASVEEGLRHPEERLALIDDAESAFDVALQIIDSLLQGGKGIVETPPPAAVPNSTADNLADRPARSELTFLPLATPEPGAAPADPTPAAAPAAPQSTQLRVRAELIDHLVNQAGELSIARNRIEGEMRAAKESLLDLTENVIRLRRQLREIEIQAESQMQSRTTQASEVHPAFDPLEFDRFTRFQELTRMMAESVNDVGTVQQSLLQNLNDADAALLAQSRLNRELQQELMGVRMLPFASSAERLYRIVRQAAKEQGKRANLDLIGGQVELDRSVLETIAAPVEHLLRNAIAHGLETQAVREAAGKPAVGEIVIRLAQEGNEIILELRDDGAGLNLARIAERGRQAGLLSAEQTPSDNDLIDLIFEPGFSTASELSQIAGRGIGMDVVKTEIANLGGRIEIETRAGHGTTFRLYLPLTLAVTQSLLIRAGSHEYAIPSSMIAQVLELKTEALAGLQAEGQALWQGQAYPLHYLPHLLGETAAVPEAHRRHWVLLLRSGPQRAAIHVDEIRGNREVVVKNVGPQLARVVGIAGATVLGNGQVLLILNPVALAHRAPTISARVQSGAAADTPVPLEPAGVAPQPPTVLVVDDSLTVRRITSRLLAREGYQVVLAKDGVEALELLSELTPEIILSDIEMPRMDGFDLARNIRNDERLKDIPIVMITSRTAEKHRTYAEKIGVNHYLGKPYQEDELLALVARYAATTSPVQP